MKTLNIWNISIILFLFLASIIFAWPMFARNSCAKLVKQRIDAPGDITVDVGNNVYRMCLVTHGLKPEVLF